MKIVAALAACSLAISLPVLAHAATVNSAGGQVLINRGDGYKQVVGSTEGNPGDTVVANPGSGGTIVYADGCTVNIEPGTVVTIAASPPCASGTGGVSGTTFAIGAAVVGGGVAAALLLGKGGDKSASP